MLRILLLFIFLLGHLGGLGQGLASGFCYNWYSPCGLVYCGRSEPNKEVARCARSAPAHIDGTDVASIVAKMKRVLACQRKNYRRDLAKITLELLAIKGDFPAGENRTGFKPDKQTYLGLLKATAAGRRIARDLKNVFKAPPPNHPLLTEDQIILLRSAVFLGCPSGSSEPDSEILAEALLTVGDLAACAVASKKTPTSTLFVLPFYATARCLHRGEEENTNSGSTVQSMVDARLGTVFSLSQASLKYFFGETTPSTKESEMRRRVLDEQNQVSRRQEAEKKGAYIFYVHKLALSSAVLMLLDYNGDAKLPFSLIAKADSPQLSKYNSWVALLNYQDMLINEYQRRLHIIRSTAVEPYQDLYHKETLDKLRGLLKASTDEIRTGAIELFDNVREVPMPLQSRIAVLGEW